MMGNSWPSPDGRADWPVALTTSPDFNGASVRDYVQTLTFGLCWCRGGDADSGGGLPDFSNPLARTHGLQSLEDRLRSHVHL